jgi:hypothetical protein
MGLRQIKYKDRWASRLRYLSFVTIEYLLLCALLSHYLVSCFSFQQGKQMDSTHKLSPCEVYNIY